MSDEIADDALPDSAAEFESMAYRELQSLAERVGVAPTLDREELTEALTESLGLGEE